MLLTKRSFELHQNMPFPAKIPLCMTKLPVPASSECTFLFEKGHCSPYCCVI